MAGCGRVLTLLPNDGMNLLITVEANYINPRIRIAARTTENNLADKFRRAGADYVVNPSFIGGMRLASVIIRPQVVSFLDEMLRGREPYVRVEEATIEEGSPLIGRTLLEADLPGRTGLNPVALKEPGSSEYLHNPTGREMLVEDMVIIVIGERQKIGRLKGLCGG